MIGSLDQKAKQDEEDVSSLLNAPPAHHELMDRAKKMFALDRYAGLYVALLLALFFELWEPSKFGTVSDLRVIASGQAITGLLTLGLIVSLLAGMFDVSIAANMSLAITLVGWLQADGHVNAVVAVFITLFVGALIGATNAFVITVIKVEPVIATLGMSSILAAVAYWISGGNTIVDGISHSFNDFGSSEPLSIPIEVYFLVVVAVVLWYVLEHTPRGRYLYAIGANVQASRLAGLKVVPLKWLAAITTGVLASLAGIVLTMQLGAASFGAGTPYLLPAFAVAFLGATQIHPGRFNVAGTLVALYLLAIGVQGLELHYPSLPWIAELFEGIALIVAVGIGARSSARRN